MKTAVKNSRTYVEEHQAIWKLSGDNTVHPTALLKKKCCGVSSAE